MTQIELPDTPKIGDVIKVYLPGERPFAQVNQVWNRTLINGRFEAKLWGAPKHRYQKGDEATFYLRLYDWGKDYSWCWELAPLSDQRHSGPRALEERP